jgi:hypothetical protein
MIASAPTGTAIHTVAFEKESATAFADQAVIDGAKAMAMTAIDYWMSTELQKSISSEFEATNADKNVL